jgi:hypothetical protein
MEHISNKTIKEQRQEDLIGKDAYRGTSLTYAFLANQFGHFSLGFIPTVLVYLCLEKFNYNIKGEHWVFICVGISWTIFEIVNSYLNIFKHPDHAFTKFKLKSFPFKPSWGNLFYDFITDVGFFWFGAFFAGAFYVMDLFHSLIYILPFALLFIPYFYWYITRMYLQMPGYPVQYRLSQWQVEVEDEAKLGVYNFMHAAFSGTHLMIFGEDTHMNTMLGIGIATEKSFKHHKCSYTTVMKLCNLFAVKTPNVSFLKPAPSWNWDNANYIVIDDVAVSNPEITPIAADEFKKNLLHIEFAERNKNVLKEKKIIWIFGKDDAAKSVERKWVDLLVEIGVAQKNIIAINVVEKKEKA